MLFPRTRIGVNLSMRKCEFYLMYIDFNDNLTNLSQRRSDEIPILKKKVIRFIFIAEEKTEYYVIRNLKQVSLSHPIFKDSSSCN